MNRIPSITFSIFAILIFALSPSAFAADAGAGQAVFSANCAVCHARGNNTINPSKTIKKADLEQNDMFFEDAITTQVRNGNGSMPSFGGILSDADIENVAAYVLDQADKW